MNICIIGAGVVGSFLAEKLAKEGIPVSVIDTDSIKLENLAYKKNILAINCDITQEECIEKCKDYDFYLVLTDNDELNLTTALFIRELWQKENIFIRIFKPAYNPLCEKMKFNYVNVVESTISNLNLILEYPFASGVWQIRDIVIWNIKINSQFPFIGKTLKDLAPIREKFNFSVVLIRRNGKFIIPKGSTQLLNGDEIYLAVDKQHVEEFLKSLGISFKKVETVAVLGYSRYVDFWFGTLNEKTTKVKFFHPSSHICERVGQRYPFIEVYQTYTTDKETLISEGISEADYVWCLDEIDEKNIVTALFVKNLSAKRVGVLLKHPQYEDFISESGIDAYVLPKKVTASKIYSLLKGKAILEVIELAEGVDVFEEIYNGEAIPLKKLKLEKNELVLFIIRDGKTLIPKGETIVEKGDALLILKKI
jgi:trk system potassium uptake protein TrkA